MLKIFTLELFRWMPLLSWIFLNQIHEYLIFLNVPTKPIATFRVKFNCLWLTLKRTFLLKQLFLENSAMEHGAVELLCIMLGQFLFAFRWCDQLTFQHKDPSEQYREFDVTVSLSQALNLKSICYIYNICTSLSCNQRVFFGLLPHIVVSLFVLIFILTDAYLNDHTSHAHTTPCACPVQEMPHVLPFLLPHLSCFCGIDAPARRVSWGSSVSAGELAAPCFWEGASRKCHSLPSSAWIKAGWNTWPMHWRQSMLAACSLNSYISKGTGKSVFMRKRIRQPELTPPK